MKYYIVDAFTDKPFGGNPAGVVLLEGDAFPNEQLMLQIAAELRYSETAFVKRHSATEFTIRYFTPAAEVDLCGHATIATFSLLHKEYGIAGQCLCHTKAGDLTIEVGEQVMMQMATPRIVATIDEVDEIYQALGLKVSNSNVGVNTEPTDTNPMVTPSTLPIQIVKSGLPDIIIPIPSVATLQALQPDMAAITAITRKYSAVSFHLFAFSNDYHTAHVRDFAPLYDIPEESATGTANASLTHYLQQNGCIPQTGDFTFLQGEAMGRPSVVVTRVAADGTVYVGGTAAVVAKGELL